MKKKIIIISVMCVLILIFSGITYSVLSTGVQTHVNQNIAKFVFDADKTDMINLPLYDFKPGDTKEYKFSISNNKEENDSIISSDVTIIYNIIINTYHFMPLDIKLYKIVNDKEEEIMVCDETKSRNENNELVCKSSDQRINYRSNKNDDYVLKLTFDERYNSYEYSNLVDYIDLKIESYQDVG